MRSLSQYREYLKELDYPEYAHIVSKHRPTSRGGGILDLSLWGDAIHPGMVAAIKDALLSISKYESAQNCELLERISNRFKYPKKYVSIVAGADDALRIASQYCIRPGSKVLIPVPSFGRYEYHAYVNEAEIHYLRFNEYPYQIDIDKVIKHANKNAIECIFLANPNSPTGCAISREDIMRLVSSVTASVILDESLLIETRGSISSTFLGEFDNLFVCGSLSKLYSLAGVRVGYLVFNDKHRAGMQKLISPFEVSSLGIALANFALSQEEWTRFKTQGIRKGIEMLRSFDHPDVRVSCTSAPIALLECTNPNLKLYNLLRSNGVLTVPGGNFRGLEGTNTVRIIIRNDRDISQLLRRLRKIL